MMSRWASCKQGIITATIIGFAATGVTIILVPLVLTDPPTRSEYFWYRILWTEFLAALVWAYIGAFFSLVLQKNRSMRGLGAILPALGIIIFFYAISSFVLMLIAAYWPTLSFISYASQIDKAAGLVVTIVFLYFSWVTGVAGSEPFPEGIHTPKDLIIMLRQEENSILSKKNVPLRSDLMDDLNILRLSLKNLRERIQYSIPHVGSIGEDHYYRDFSNAVNKFCLDCSKLDSQVSDVDKLRSIIQHASDLNSKVQYIAQKSRNE